MPKIDLKRFNIQEAITNSGYIDERIVRDEGPWSVDVWQPKEGKTVPRVVLQSGDFEFDAALEVSGDFTSIAQKVEYAQHIADKLNSRK